MQVQAALIALALALLAGCGKTTERALRDVQPPKTVPVVVKQTIRLPSWATAEIPNPPPRDGKVRTLIESNDARGAKVDYANCRSRLIERVQNGETVDPKECAQ